MREAPVEDLPLLDQVIHRPDRLLEGRPLIPAVALIQIDMIGLQPPQARGALLHDVLPRQPRLVGQVPHRKVDLGRQDKRVPALSLQKFAPDRLRLPLRVHVGGVQEVDSHVEGRLQDPLGLLLGECVPHREPATKADFADLKAGIP